MWSFTDDYSILPNLYIRSQFKDGALQFYEIYPCDGYVLRIPSGDEYQMDKEENLILDENGNPILVRPYRTYGGATAMPNYDWTTNPENYYAEPYEEV